MSAATIEVGDVVQIAPAYDEWFGGCLLLVTEVKAWGVQGFVKIPGSGDAYYRAPFTAVFRIGRAEWTPS